MAGPDERIAVPPLPRPAGGVRSRSGISCTGRAPAAFSLIELLVVIAIVAVLAAMLLPAVRIVKEQSMQSVCSSNMRQISLGVQTYRTEYDSLYPPFALGTAAQDWWSYGPGGRWQHYIETYTETFAVFNCPVNKRVNDLKAIREIKDSLANRGYAPNGLVCLTAADSRVWFRYPKGGPQAWAPSSPYGPMSDASASAYLAKLATTVAAYMPPNPAPEIGRCPLLSDGVWQNDGTNQSGDQMNGAYWPHRNKTSNFIFNDGHVESIAIGEFSFGTIVQSRR